MSNSTSKTMQTFIEQENKNSTVVIYSKTYCPYCRQAKALFNSLPNVQVQVHEMDVEENGALIQKTLYQMTGQRSVPNIFVNNRHVGGNDDVQDAHVNGDLQQWLKNTQQEGTVQ